MVTKWQKEKEKLQTQMLFNDFICKKNLISELLMNSLWEKAFK